MGRHGANVALDGMEAICRERGGRLMPQRRAVLGALLLAQRPQSAYELRDTLLPHDPAITPASVYRCLDFLMEHGLVHRLETTRSFVACGHPDHAHAVQFLICRQCGTVVEAEDKRVAAATARRGHPRGGAVGGRTGGRAGVLRSGRPYGGTDWGLRRLPDGARPHRPALTAAKLTIVDNHGRPAMVCKCPARQHGTSPSRRNSKGSSATASNRAGTPTPARSSAQACGC